MFSFLVQRLTRTPVRAVLFPLPVSAAVSSGLARPAGWGALRAPSRVYLVSNGFRAVFEAETWC